MVIMQKKACRAVNNLSCTGHKSVYFNSRNILKLRIFIASKYYSICTKRFIWTMIRISSNIYSTRLMCIRTQEKIESYYMKRFKSQITILHYLHGCQIVKFYSKNNQFFKFLIIFWIQTLTTFCRTILIVI